MSQFAWEHRLHNLVQDFIDLFLPADYPFPIEKGYPNTASIEVLIKDHSNSLELPDTTLLNLNQLSEESNHDQFSHKFGDWGIIFAYNVLEGFGHQAASNLDGMAFSGLRELAATFGSFLGHELQRVFTRYSLFLGLGNFLATIVINVFSQIPSKELGDAVRESITPSYLRAGETVRYELALLDNNQTRTKESLSILKTSDAELEREIAQAFSGYSSEDLGKMIQRNVIQEFSRLTELFANKEFAEELITRLPRAFRGLSWYVGRRLQLNLQNDPQRTERLLKIMDQYKEIGAAFEMYRYKYGWHGDQNDAVILGWQAISPKHFNFSRRVEDIHEEERQEQLIGVAEGLEDYVYKNPAIGALEEGFLGKLGAYLVKAANNNKVSYNRKKMTNGNRVLTEAKHAEDLYHQDMIEGDELSEEEILSIVKEKLYPLKDPILEDLVYRETLEEWNQALTDKQRTAVKLMYRFGNQKEAADVMGISQPAMSQLLSEAWSKFLKIRK